MKVLVLNSGSSSIKYQLFNMKDEKILAKGIVERIGDAGAALAHDSAEKQPYRLEQEIKDHSQALQLLFGAITDPEYGVVSDAAEIDAIGHRVVHGGEIFHQPVLVDTRVKEGIRQLAELAPLHNPANLLGIEACEKLIPGIKQVAVFDTGFYHSIKPQAFMYSIPYKYYEKYSIRKYGFHGTSHQYVAQRAAAMLGRPLEEIKLVTCHLGSGASITAISGGHPIDTSMGMTPLEGITMSTRSGDLDPAIITFLMEKEVLTPREINSILNHQSGVLGISGLSGDFRDLQKAADGGNQRARLAIDVFVHRVKKYIGAYVAELNGIDALVFTAGLGENSPEIRRAVCQDLDYLYLWVDKEKNQIRGREADVSAAGSQVRVLVIPTNEELMIALETVSVMEKIAFSL